jgi:hypothetical protein
MFREHLSALILATSWEAIPIAVSRRFAPLAVAFSQDSTIAGALHEKVTIVRGNPVAAHETNTEGSEPQVRA